LASPPAGKIKANWDAAVDKVRKKMGIGVILQDCNGEVLATLSAPKDFIIAPEIAEATAALRAAYFCQELGFSHIILEGDALQVVQALANR
jgi:hypothetical protein